MVKRRSQKDVYNHIKSFAEFNGMTKENSSMLTLLLPPGCEYREKKLLSMVKKLLKPTNRKYIVVIEPVVAEPELYKAANFNMYSDPLPFFHAHILIQEFDRELRSLRDSWSKLIGKTKQRLFHCSHIEKSISASVNYMTKYYETKRNASPVTYFEDSPQVIAPIQEEKINLQTNEANLRETNVKTEAVIPIIVNWLFKIISYPGLVYSLIKYSWDRNLNSNSS